jgi:outer membrane protein OmpA-like peptidoglycan-associated protein
MPSFFARSASAAVGLFVTAALVVGCGRGTILAGRISGLQEIVDQAERNGAYRCAPRELALAKANLEFATTELGQGDAGRAEDHVELAEPNARAALRLSPAARCAPRGVAVVRRAPPPPPPPPPPPGDRDGDGIIDDVDQCPAEPEDFDGFEDAEGCPEDQDSDGDGLADSRDACVAEPEDVDGYMDTDGCPEPDNDADGILDATDRCGNDAEDPDGYNDTDGCPDRDNDTDGTPDVADRCPNEPGPEAEQGCPRVYQDVQITDDAIRITQMIHFEFNRAVIRPESFGILNTVAQVLRDFPNITLEIGGHTDSRGNDALNLRLSADRAEAVRVYLIGQGTAANRLTSRGYGETAPIESNRSDAGRAANRRVEFSRTDSNANGGR